jgi:F-type H+-transporting ATPase subunit b
VRWQSVFVKGVSMLHSVRHASLLVLISTLTLGLSGTPAYALADQEESSEQAVDHDKGAAHGEGGHEEHPMPPLLSFDIGSAICNLAIFLIVLAVLSKFVWPQILEGLDSRDEKIRSDLEHAEKANSEAKALLSEYQSKLDAAGSEVQALLAEARRDAEANGQRIVEDAKAEAARQTERAVAEIETAKKVAIAELAGQTSEMAIGVAKQIVGRELKPEDHQDLIRQSLDRLPSNN